MTEEDTFNALRRISYSEMQIKIDDWIYSGNPPSFEQLFEDNGWTREEYMRANS